MTSTKNDEYKTNHITNTSPFVLDSVSQGSQYQYVLAWTLSTKEMMDTGKIKKLKYVEYQIQWFQSSQILRYDCTWEIYLFDFCSHSSQQVTLGVVHYHRITNDHQRSNWEIAQSVFSSAKKEKETKNKVGKWPNFFSLPIMILTDI